jgi:hypothetical protein
MVRITPFLLCVLTVLSAAASATVQSAASTQPIPRIPQGVQLEVVSTDFDIGWSDSYLYLRVYDNGRAECRVVERQARMTTAARDVVGYLGRDLSARIARFLNSPQLASAQSMGRGVIDAGTVWRVVWRDSLNKVHEISTVVAVDLGVGGRTPTTRAILDLQCMIAAARSKLTNLPTDLTRCSEVSLSAME